MLDRDCNQDTTKKRERGKQRKTDSRAAGRRTGGRRQQQRVGVRRGLNWWGCQPPTVTHHIHSNMQQKDRMC